MQSDWVASRFSFSLKLSSYYLSYSLFHLIFAAMKVKMILPALEEAESPYWRPIKYALFPPLGLATLAGYFSPYDEVVLQDQHVEKLDLDDSPDLVCVQVYITNAYRAYKIADSYRKRGIGVVLGGLLVTSLPKEAAEYADT